MTLNNFFNKSRIKRDFGLLLFIWSLGCFTVACSEKQIIVLSACGEKYPMGYSKFNNNWRFLKSFSSGLFDKKDEAEWENISLPHTAQIEPAVITGKQWQGLCYYRKFFILPTSLKGKHVALKFEGVMQIADVYFNGKLLATHKGGYLPFYVDITKEVKYGKENCVLVKLDNRDAPQTPPGKPIDELDFNYFSGIYRNIFLVVKNPVHISDEIETDKVAGGGVFVSFPLVNQNKAHISVKTDIKNESLKRANTQVQLRLMKEGKLVAESNSETISISAQTSHNFEQELQIKEPELWSPSHPSLYDLEVVALVDKKEVDSRTEQIGIRTFAFSAKRGFSINGKKLKLRGTNRHQEYPYIGYALSDNANYRDAWKIKHAGFNFVRLSHYPQSRSFLRACDQLGLLVMDAIPGWQFFGDSEFQKNAIRDVRQMVRRSRNHPCVILWEASLNESGMTTDFMKKAHNAVHEEYPGSDVYTCGWLDEVYDVFIPARQHGKSPGYWKKYNKDKPLFIAEYGDWEYYAQNAGFNQAQFEGLKKEERSSRQLRKSGQVRLAQQAFNYQESHNDNLYGSSAGDANWLMFDYNRGYAPDIESSGIMDIFRLAKFSYYFYQSQKHIKTPEDAVLFIANYWNDPNYTDVKIYSNCDEVELFVNGNSLGRQKPDSDINSVNLDHPPFSFKPEKFVTGTLLAKGYVKDKEIVEITRKTPGKAFKLKIWIDESGKPLSQDYGDVVFLYAAVIDKSGTMIPDAMPEIKFEVEGKAELIGNPVKAEAGIATVLLKLETGVKELTVLAKSDGLKEGVLQLETE